MPAVDPYCKLPSPAARVDNLQTVGRKWQNAPSRGRFPSKSDLSLDELLAHLNTVGPWNGQSRDSTWYGSYLASRDAPFGAVLRVYSEDDHFVLEMHRTPATSSEFDNLIATMRDSFLRSIGARDIAPHEGID
jgi:hypothetical protein